MNGYKHYIRISDNAVVIHGFSDAFEKPQANDICILEDGPRHFHEVWPEPLQNERGQFCWRWVNGQRVERTQAELDAEWATRPPDPPTFEERLEAAEQALIALMEAMNNDV